MHGACARPGLRERSQWYLHTHQSQVAKAVEQAHKQHFDFDKRELPLQPFQPQPLLGFVASRGHGLRMRDWGARRSLSLCIVDITSNTWQ